MKLPAFMLAIVTLWASCATAQRGLGDRTDPTIAPWARESVQRLLLARIAFGYPDGRFHGDRSANRFTASSMAGRLLIETGTPRKLYADRQADVLIAAFAPAAQPTPQEEIKDFILKDLDTNIYGGELVWGDAAEAGIIKGFPDGYYRGKRPLTRADLAVLVSRLLRHIERKPSLDLAKANYRDLDGDEWYFGAVLVAGGTGIMQGYADHTFRPRQPVTRNELAVTFTCLLDLAKTP